MSKITQLPEVTNPSSGDDVIELAIDTVTTPLSRKIKFLNLLRRLFLGDGTQLTITTIADGEFLKRSGTNITSGVPSGSLDAEAVQDIVGAMVVAGTNITVTYNDGAGTLTVDSTGSGSIAPLTIIDANTVEQKNGTNVQSFSVYKTTTNGYKFSVKSVAGFWELASESSSGTPDPVKLRVTSALAYSFDSGNFLPASDQGQQLGGGGTRWTSIFGITFDATSGGEHRWSNSTRLLAPSNGILRIVADSGSTGHIILGNNDTSGIRLKQNGTRLDIRLGGDSAYTQLTCEQLGVNNSAAATTPGSVTKKIEVFDAAGNSLGFIAVYDSIT